MAELDWGSVEAGEERLEEKLKEMNVGNVDVIVASDVIYNKTQLEMVPRFLSALCGIFQRENEGTSPVILMSYKSRHEDLDENLCSTFEKYGIEGEQAASEEMDEALLCEPIDVFILYLKERKGLTIEFNRPK